MENKKKIVFLYITLLHISVFVNYKLFLILFISFSIRQIYVDQELKKFNNIFFKLLPYSYFIKQVLNFLEEPKSSIFWDMQNFLHYIKCNNLIFSYEYKLDLIIKDCPKTIGYGPLTEFIKLDIEDIWFTTSTIAVIFLIFCTTILFLYNGNSLIIVSTFVSPAFHFLLFSLSSDLFVILFIIYILLKNNIRFSYLNLVLLSLITQIKLFTFAIFFGYCLVFYIRKESKYFLITLGVLISNLILLLNHYIIESQLIPRPISFTRSFGVLHDFILLNEHIGYDEFLLLIFPFMFLIIVNKNKIFKTISDFYIELEKTIYYKALLILPLLLLINFYQNWGYKFIFNSFLFVLIFNKLNKIGKIFAIITTLISSTYYSIGWGFEENILNYIFILANKVNFYFFLIFLLIFSIKILDRNYTTN